MDWQRIKQASNDFDALLEKRITPPEACEDAQIMLAALMYSDAKWVSEMPKEQRKESLHRVYAPFQEDVREMAKMILTGRI